MGFISAPHAYRKPGCQSPATDIQRNSNCQTATAHTRLIFLRGKFGRSLKSINGLSLSVHVAQTTD